MRSMHMRMPIAAETRARGLPSSEQQIAMYQRCDCGVVKSDSAKDTETEDTSVLNWPWQPNHGPCRQ